MSRFPHHNPIDSSCASLECEELEFDCSDFLWGLQDDLGHRSLFYLERNYPELVFGFVKGSSSKKPKGFDFTGKLPGGYRTAKWRVK